MRCSSKRLPDSPASHAFRSRQLFAAGLVCIVFLATQARADKLRLKVDDDSRAEHAFTVFFGEHEDGALVRNLHVADSEAYSRRLKFKIGDRDSGGSSLGNTVVVGNNLISDRDELPDTPSTPTSTVPEPSSLLLMSAGLLGFATLLRSRLTAKAK